MTANTEVREPMTEPSGTPRTDALVQIIEGGHEYCPQYVLLPHARRLERELAEARGALLKVLGTNARHYRELAEAKALAERRKVALQRVMVEVSIERVSPPETKRTLQKKVDSIWEFIEKFFEEEDATIDAALSAKSEQEK